MDNKVKTTLMSFIGIFVLFAGIAGYYVINLINDLANHKAWWYDSLVLIIVLWEVAYSSMHIWQISKGVTK